MANRNPTFELTVLLILVLLTKSKFLEALRSNSHATVDFNISCIEKEREALLQFKDGLKDPSGWLSSWVGDDCCNWVGVSCSIQTGHVVTLELKGSVCDSYQENKAAYYRKSCLFGKLNPSLLNLPFLSYLDLSGNNFHGNPIPEFIGSLKNLRYLDLSQASFTGMVPSSLGNLSNLEHLDLSHNSFFGSLPRLGNLSLLSNLDLSFNLMDGMIPEDIGQLSELFTLNLYGNSWKSVISENHFRNLSGLTFLYLSSTNKSLVFNVRHDWVAPFSLSTLAIGDCQLGSAFPSWLESQAGISRLTLSNVGLLDTIPGWFWRLLPQAQWLDLSDNQIRGELPKSINVRVDAWIDLGFNRLEGSLPLWSNVSNLSLRNNLLTGSIPIDIGHRMSIFENLDLSNNLLNGSIPQSISEMRNLSFLDLSNNHLSREIPSNWQGLDKLRVIDLSKNRLSGGIPSSICSLPSLVCLRLSSNNLSGELSASLQDCTRLLSLDLGQNGFFGTIRPIAEKLINVSYLGLRANMLTGSIPEQLCGFPVLHILDLAHNNLSGGIPTCLGNLKAMKYTRYYSSVPPSIERIEFTLHAEFVVKGRQNEYRKINSLLNIIDLSSNNLIGEIPEEITSLTVLHALNLSWNQLTGKIPENIGSLQQLETLDLSCNHLSGPIPPSMSSMTFLSHLNLSYNNLSGKILSSNQFATWNDPSIYEGNLYLCGPPLTTNCSSGHGDSEDNDKVEDEDKSEKFWFYVSVVLGFIVGFWAVCGTLIIKESWRHTYFRFVDETKDKLFVIIAVHVGHLYKKVCRCQKIKVVANKRYEL
ncbi:hypothetical protein Dsin_010647 [Dipteronia sinensis]|uniref:Leucine-rich repeat-containing N-terminal plant-type domain-containing protein n=1 Tax=Dipteronia sinensis TaxID=43782 RepID=A0AAE0AT42_9ROSI|nr:hypothetical protein Dsin_010647 [Dipteronia sinensis]